MLDVSSALGSGDVDNLKQYAKERINNMDLASGNKAGIVVVSDAAQTEMLCPLTTDAGQLLSKIDQIAVKPGQANVAEAIKLVNTVFQANSDRSQNMEVVLAGKSSSTTAELQDAISASNAKGVHALAIGAGSGVDSTQLQTIASQPTTDNMIQVQDSTSLVTVADSVVGCCPPTIYQAPVDNTNCASVEARVPKSLNSVDSTGTPACWYGEVKNMLAPYDCQDLGVDCNLLKCNKALPDEIMGQLQACK